jgi:hypothetical protein
MPHGPGCREEAGRCDWMHRNRAKSAMVMTALKRARRDSRMNGGTRSPLSRDRERE